MTFDSSHNWPNIANKNRSVLLFPFGELKKMHSITLNTPLSNLQHEKEIIKGIVELTSKTIDYKVDFCAVYLYCCEQGFSV